MRTQIYYDDNS